MSFWTEVHWSEGMFLRPHHLQAGQRWMEGVVRAGLDATRPYAWGFLELEIAEAPLEKLTLRLDSCLARLADGAWVKIPENTVIEPLDFEAALDAAKGPLDIYLGVPLMQAVRANSVSLQHPERTEGTPRFEPQAITRRDENTGENPQTVYVRRMRAKLFAAGDDMTGYETLRIGAVVRTDRPGAIPEVDDRAAGPLLAIQADPGLSRMLSSLTDQIEAKNEVLAREAREHRMLFTDGVATNTEHLLKLHALNEARSLFAALMQSPLLHPFDVFVTMARLIGHLSVFHDALTPADVPTYDHDRPAASLLQMKARIEILLDAMRPMNYLARPFVRKRDNQNREGLEVELDREWIDGNLELYVGLSSDEMDVGELERHIYGRLNLKLASLSRAPRISNIAVRGLKLDAKEVPAGTLPRRQGLHYYRISKAIGADHVDYWQECEQERGIRVSIQEGQLAAFEEFQPTLYVVTQKRS